MSASEDGGDQSCTTGFNGATTFQPWKSWSFVTTTVSPGALQWGHDFSAVEILEGDRMTSTAMMLQWGHDFSAVEM